MIKIITANNIHDQRQFTDVDSNTLASVYRTEKGLETLVNEFVTNKTVSNVTVTYNGSWYIATVVYTE